ncbi:type IX secretion system protein PorQ [Bernardetia sp. OM2101]|uniref:type IX secretion system protein PorQ n=1 Tax=Bernardetia sp. OM2101 TaxID=3344876 RepID=UPI0035D00431
MYKFLSNKLFFLSSFSILFYLLLAQNSVFGQIGGKTSLEFINLPTHARIIGLGGANITSQDAGEQQDINMHIENPALLTDATHDRLSLAYYGYSAGISNVNLAYGHDFKKLGRFSNLAFSFQYLDYGNIESYDALGNSLGQINASEYSFGVSHSQKFDAFRVGGTLKIAGSQLAGYNATGVYLDLGGTLTHPDKDLRFGLVMNNLGFLISNYSPTSDYEMPMNILLGASLKPEKMPVRFSLTLQQLFRKNIAYNDPARSTTLDANGQVVVEETSAVDKAFRRIVLGAEIIFSKNFNLRAGYNFLRRRELTVTARPAFVGFSFGGVLRVRSFEFAYSRSLAHIAGGTNNFTITLDTKKLFRKN